MKSNKPLQSKQGTSNTTTSRASDIMAGHLFFFVSLVSCVFLFGPPLIAGPTLIQDNRISNLGVTPVLGRGYTISTNTFQSTCLKEVKTTEPSYDFTYQYKEMDAFLKETNDEENYLLRLSNKSFRNYLVEQEQEAKNERRGTTSTTTGKVTKKIVVSILLDSYYASVDESGSGISDSATNLLIANDILGFFSSCGSYYVRSIRRNALFISVFEFESVSVEEDKKFIYELETELKGFKKSVVGTTNAEEEITGTDVQLKVSGSISQMATERNLMITVAAFGLGKNEKATLISHDIKSFKVAIKDAFLSMQNPKTGKVTSIEVVPWVENTEFQSLILLKKKTLGDEPKPGSAKNRPEAGRMLLNYEKKYILNLNAEFLAEIERADRAMMNTYYKAKMCKKHIETNWKHLRGGKRVFKPAYRNRYVMNNQFSNAGVKLTFLDSVLTDDRIDALLRHHRQFMYGGGIWAKGATSCVNQLTRYGLFKMNYREIDDCAALERNLSQVEDEIVENHCMPVLYNSGTVPDEITSPSP